MHLRRLAFLSILVAVSCRDVPKTVDKEVLVWRPVNTWTGHTNLQTESFPGESGAFQVHWESKPLREAPAAIFKVTLHSAVSGRPLVVAVEHPGAGKDTAYVVEDPREFYLVIEGQGTAWSVTLEEGLRATKREVVKE